MSGDLTSEIKQVLIELNLHGVQFRLSDTDLIFFFRSFVFRPTCLHYSSTDMSKAGKINFLPVA